MNDELKPCPFCGRSGFQSFSNDTHYITCNNPECNAMPMVSGDDEQEAVVVWNRRANPTPRIYRYGEQPEPTDGLLYAGYVDGSYVGVFVYVTGGGLRDLSGGMDSWHMTKHIVLVEIPTTLEEATS